MTLPFVISIPHCSARVPEDIRDTLVLSEQQILDSVDYGTAEIFGRLPAKELIKAQWSRLVVDLNRAPDQTDPKGVVALTDYHGRTIYRPGLEPDQEAITKRVALFHRPYHEKLEQALGHPDIIGLVDSHALCGIGPADAPDPGKRRKDISLGNFGDSEGRPRPGLAPPSSSADQLQLFKHAFKNQGFSVSLNTPYEGGYILSHYGPQLVRQGSFAILIEMNQDLYTSTGSSEHGANRIEEITHLVHTVMEEIAATLS